MDEKRYQVFVSSTYKDLTEERAAVIQAILSLEHFPAGMELFPAANDDQWTLIKQVIDQSDYYVVVVGGRYGSVSAEGISYTEMEYDYAVETGTPILGFVHGEPDKIESGKTESTQKARRKLAEFRAKVETRMVKHFTSPDQLGGQVITSLNREIKKSPRTGWVRGDKAMTVETEREILDLRERLAESEKERESAQKALIENTSDLAQGSDEVTIPLLVTGYGDNYQDKKRAELHATTTWDAIFSDIGPVMIDEATDRVVRDRLRDHLVASTIPKQEVKEVQGWKSRDIKIFNDDWDQVQVQFRALGLIDKGQRKRTASDTHKYLALTEKGDRHLAFLRAIRREFEDTE
ncbi:MULTISPECIES: DUF4062 domain-containing protein [Mycobacterium]|uniref:DUF4062 domain-containing protein n=1 Tax=Mycobacterium TaxID=1763 RepID=UPI000800D6F5|nr:MULTISPECIES: DUF4062 domain-containing protein [Mycobacterium]OBG72366.1 hypothetical protein A9X05_27500 [Mycobacterium sp. E3298]UQB93073.1 DUF4062 domain-containing protein [Mycobacterium intracellulare]WSE46214.1 DUF4062 domain-containing protein [Mycobacterium sp. 3-98]